MISLLLNGQSAKSICQPITVGIPFARGALTSLDSLTLFDAQGRQHPLQVQPQRRWSDRSIQWLLLDFILNSTEGIQEPWSLHQGATHSSFSDSSGLRVEQASTGYLVDNGASAFHLHPSSLLPFSQVTIGSRNLLQPATTRISLTDAKGQTASPCVESSSWETHGPVRATLRQDGYFKGNAPCRFVARYCFFANTGLVRVRLTIHNPNRAKHPGGLWDLGDPGSVFFRDLSVELGMSAADEPEIFWKAEVDHQAQSQKGKKLEIYQDSSGGENWQSKNHVNRDGKVPCSFRGYRVRKEAGEERGLRASPVVSLRGAGGTLTAALPEFWQQFPKAIEVEGNLLRLRLFPQQFGDLFELQGGEQKTFTCWLHFAPPGESTEGVLDFVHQPARVHASPEWYAASDALPYLLPDCEPSEQLDGFLSEALDGEKSLFARREVIDEYGWRNYGEVYADHEAEYYDGPLPAISHYNNQYDQVLGMLLQYLRTGDTRWFDLGDALARHVIDIDIYHTDQDKAAYNGGLFWFTDHYQSAATCTHRTYSRNNCAPGDKSYGGGPSSNHLFTTGLLHYYFLTGDPNAKDAVLRLANWVINMEDGRQTIFGMLDDGPTGLASATATHDYHGPGRGGGNSINALLDGWMLTGQRHYLDKAEELIRRCVHPHDDIAARGLLNAEKRWSYTVFFVTLSRYLRVKAEMGELDYMYAYARAGFLHYATWMLASERPYYDHPEQLEYPTEAWAGQEFRKANVLRLASAHADEPLKSQFLQRGQQLAERAWSDLLRFESRTSARGVALMMIEGLLDAYVQPHSLPDAPRPAKEYDYGQPEEFVSQKYRVLSRLKSPLGCIQAALRLLKPRNWPALLALLRK